ncbi:hypothetical protein PCANC_02901 [Puccinia coronata f. sp. avenae]|uniref:Uncharacterized protein n=1 Tax=Puccinia coronata f. sp. avenae TaxID=200324 RepID=A0A2N5T8G2_9BASI|nr:hypothetical protein PCANC_02901 [Puccinia coronata f. sp. avenae]
MVRERDARDAHYEAPAGKAADTFEGEELGTQHVHKELFDLAGLNCDPAGAPEVGVELNEEAINSSSAFDGFDEARGLIAARPKGVRTPPQTPKKRRAGAARLPIQACKPPHAARRLHTYKWREDGWLGVRPRRTDVLAMHACPEGVQALHALRTGVHGRHACSARLT